MKALVIRLMLLLAALLFVSCATERRSVSRDAILKALASDENDDLSRSPALSAAALRVVLPTRKTLGSKRTALGRVRIATRDGNLEELVAFEPTSLGAHFHRCSALVLLEREEEALSSCAALLESGSHIEELAAVELLRRAVTESKAAEQHLDTFYDEVKDRCATEGDFDACALAYRVADAMKVELSRVDGTRVSTSGVVIYRVRGQGAVSLWSGSTKIWESSLEFDSPESVEVRVEVFKGPISLQWRSEDPRVVVESLAASSQTLRDELAVEAGAENIRVTLRKPVSQRAKVSGDLEGLDALLMTALAHAHDDEVMIRDELMLRFGDAPQVLSWLGQSRDPRLERAYFEQDQERFAAALRKVMPSLLWPKEVLDAPQGALARLGFFKKEAAQRRHWSRQVLEAALDLERSDIVLALYKRLKQDATLADASVLQRSEELLFMEPAQKIEVEREEQLAKTSDDQALRLFSKDPQAFARRLKDHDDLQGLRFHQWRVRSAQDKREALQRALKAFPLNQTFIEISKQGALGFASFPGEDELFGCQRAKAPEAAVGGDTRLLLDDERVFLSPHQRVVYRHQQIYIGDRQAAEDYGELGVDLDTWRLRFRKYRGERVERGRALTQESVALSQLDIGDIVEVCTLSFEDAAMEFREALTFGELAVADGQRTLAVHQSLLEAVETLPMAEDVVQQRMGDFEVWQVRRKLPARSGEYFTSSPGKESGVPAVISRAQLALPDVSDPWLKRVSAAAIGDAKGPAAARALARMVLQNFEHDAAQMDVLLTLSSGRGHRGQLLFALAKAAELPVEIFALQQGERFYRSTSTEDEWALRFGFFLDEVWVLTGASPSLGEIPRRFLGSERFRNEHHVFSAVSEVQDQSEVLTDDEVEHRPVHVDLELSWVPAGEEKTWSAKKEEPPGHWEGALTWAFPAGNAAALRRALLASNPSQRTTALVGAISGLLPEAQVMDVAFTELEATGEGLGVGVRLRVPANATFDDVNFDGSELGAFVDPTLLVVQSSRTHALWLPSFKSVFTLNLERPPEGSFISLPASTSSVLPGVELSLSRRVSDEGLQLKREQSFSAQRIEIGDYPSWRRRLLQIFDDSAIRFEVLLPKTTHKEPGPASP